MDMLKLLSLLVLLRQTWCGSLPPFRVILVLPNITESEPPRQSWQNGWEVLPGADLAEEDITQHFKFNMSTTTIFITDTCTSQLPLVDFVKELTVSQEEKITVAVIGLFCKDVFQELSGIAERFGLIQISCAISPPITDQNSLHYQMLPSTAAYAEALAQFMTHTGWTKIGVVYTQTSEAYYLETAAQVIQRVTEKGFKMFSTEINQQNNVYHILKDLQYSGTKIYYILLPPSEASLLICLAYDFDLRWPEYGWIVPDISLQDILSVHNSSNCNKQSTRGIFSFKNNYTNKVDGKNNETMEELLPSASNVYASVIYDSMWALALSLNQSHTLVQNYDYQTHTTFNNRTRDVVWSSRHRAYNYNINQVAGARCFGENVIQSLLRESEVKHHGHYSTSYHFHHSVRYSPKQFNYHYTITRVVDVPPLTLTYGSLLPGPLCVCVCVCVCGVK